MTRRKYDNIEKQLDKIILSEINMRVTRKAGVRKVLDINEILEKTNREIVEAHQNGNVDRKIPEFFKAFLQTRKHGTLYFEKNDLNVQEFRVYSDKKSRLEVLFAAALNALPDEYIIHIVNRKIKTFNDKYLNVEETIRLKQNALEIKEMADNTISDAPKNEAGAVMFLREILPLKTRLVEIEMRYNTFNGDEYIGEALKELQSAIHLASERISAKSKYASEFIFNHAGAIFKSFKSIKADINSIESFTDQREALERYRRLFESMGDNQRKKQIEGFILGIDATIERLRAGIDKQKQKEAKIAEKNARESEEAYQQFIDIKAAYVEGVFDSEMKKKNALEKLRKCSDILKSNGYRVKVREIERFLNSTGIGADLPITQMPFYKKAFIILLPITIGLAVLNFYLLF